MADGNGTTGRAAKTAAGSAAREMITGPLEGTARWIAEGYYAHCWETHRHQNHTAASFAAHEAEFRGAAYACKAIAVHRIMGFGVSLAEALRLVEAAQVDRTLRLNAADASPANTNAA